MTVSVPAIVVEMTEVRFGLIWLDTASEVIVLTATPVVVVTVAYEVQTPEPQTCPSRQQPPKPIVKSSSRASNAEPTHLPDLKDRRTTLDHIVLSRW